MSKESSQTSLRHMPLWVQVFISLLLTTLAVVAISDRLVKRSEEKSLAHTLSQHSKATVSLISAAAIDAVISEDIPVLETIVNQIVSIEPSVAAIYIENETGSKIVEWQSPELDADKTMSFRREVVLEGEVFGAVSVSFWLAGFRADIAQRIGLIRLRTVFFLAALTLLILICLHWLLIRPMRRINSRLLAHSLGDAELLPAYASQELHRLNDLVNMRLNIERELAKEKERLSVTLASMAEGVVVTDNESNVLLANPAAAQLLTLNQDDMVGTCFTEMIEDKAFAERWGASIKNGEALVNDNFVQNGEDDQVVAATTSMVVLGNEEAFATVTILRDITKEKEIERMKTDFVSSVSHELRTPLTAIKGFAATMLNDDGKMPAETQKEFLGIINEETDRLESLIKDLLEISLSDSGKMGLKLTMVDIGETLQKVEAIAKPGADKKDISFSISADPNIHVNADRDKLQTAILNLATNAIKFTPEGGKVSLEATYADDEMVKINVIDTGLGVPKKDIENIFGRFFRVNRPNTEIKGTGLGLAVVREIIELHGGRVYASSEMNKGSVFTIEIPL